MGASIAEDDRDFDAIEYGVRSHDDLEGTRVTPKPTLAMAEEYADYLRRISTTRRTYKIRVELVHRWPDGEWTCLNAEDAQQIKNEAWADLDRVMAPVLAQSTHPTDPTREA